MSILNINPKSSVKEISSYEKTLEDILGTKLYPKYPWICEYNKYTNSFTVKNILVSMEYGFTTKQLHLYSTYSQLWEDLKMFGGELLERANLPRVTNDNQIDILLAELEQKIMSGKYLTERTIKQLDKSK